jgi:hypothetical protein
MATCTPSARRRRTTPSRPGPRRCACLCVCVGGGVAAGGRRSGAGLEARAVCWTVITLSRASPRVRANPHGAPPPACCPASSSLVPPGPRLQRPRRAVGLLRRVCHGAVARAPRHGGPVDAGAPPRGGGGAGFAGQDQGIINPTALAAAAWPWALPKPCPNPHPHPTPPHPTLPHPPSPTPRSPSRSSTAARTSGPAAPSPTPRWAAPTT